MRRLWLVPAVALLAAYPVLVWFGLTRASSRTIGLLLLVPVAIYVLFHFRGQHQFPLVTMDRIVAILAIVLLSVSFDDERFLRVMPVLMNLLFLVHFASSLRRGSVPLIERFALIIRKQEMTPDKVRHCRQATHAWCVFFVLNGLVSLWLALFAPLSTWAMYTGGFAYILMAFMFAGEYAVRRLRFG
jgi:uncharacterized membrane protein